MKSVIHNCCLRAAKLLLYLFVFSFLGCSSLKSTDLKSHKPSESFLHIDIIERDIPMFIQRIRELNIHPIGFSQAVKETHDGIGNEFCIVFQFSTPADFFKYRMEILSTGFVRHIEYH